MPRDWTVEQLAGVARLLGRLAASRRGAGARRLDRHRPGRRIVQSYVFGRLGMQVLPVLRDRRRVAAPARRRCLRRRAPRPNARRGRPGRPTTWTSSSAFRSAPRTATPARTTCSRGASPQDLVLIDFGFWGEQPLGFDLGQLLIGDVQLGRRPAADLPALEEACCARLCRGPARRGRRDERGGGPARACTPDVDLHRALRAAVRACSRRHRRRRRFESSAERAAAARFILDLVDASTPVAAPSPA